MKPRISILDSNFKYRPAAQQDIRKTWAEAKKREQKSNVLDYSRPSVAEVTKIGRVK